MQHQPYLITPRGPAMRDLNFEKQNTNPTEFALYVCSLTRQDVEEIVREQSIRQGLDQLPSERELLDRELEFLDPNDIHPNACAKPKRSQRIDGFQRAFRHLSNCGSIPIALLMRSISAFSSKPNVPCKRWR